MLKNLWCLAPLLVHSGPFFLLFSSPLLLECLYVFVRNERDLEDKKVVNVRVKLCNFIWIGCLKNTWKRGFHASYTRPSPTTFWTFLIFLCCPYTSCFIKNLPQLISYKQLAPCDQITVTRFFVVLRKWFVHLVYNLTNACT